ncbi:MAG TPA: formate dehydrogenase subunit gamma, partial [Ramlibacter sp.]|nr:formate dehydrogenase subunit gamma [Ramlibacter sp.]
MPRSISARARSAFGAALLAAGLVAGLSAGAQTVPPADEPPAAKTAPPAPAEGGIKSQNIFEIKPDADADPNY